MASTALATQTACCSRACVSFLQGQESLPELLVHPVLLPILLFPCLLMSHILFLPNIPLGNILCPPGIWLGDILHPPSPQVSQVLLGRSNQVVEQKSAVLALPLPDLTHLQGPS